MIDYNQKRRIDFDDFVFFEKEWLKNIAIELSEKKQESKKDEKSTSILLSPNVERKG
jgi:hypothetical protein